MPDGEPESLPPPPFWRTRYFAQSVVLRPDRRGIEFQSILSVLETPYRTHRQADGRFRYWGWIPAFNRWLRVVTLDDGKTVHTALLDRDFQP